MNIPEQPDALVANRLCPACQSKLVRRPKENVYAYAVRTFCGKSCYMASKRRLAAKALDKVIRRRQSEA